MLLYGHMDQYCKHNGIPLCKHNGIPLGAHFIYLNFDSILAWCWLYLAETCRHTKKWYCHFMICIVVFADWLIYYYIVITQQDGFYQIQNKLSIGEDHRKLTDITPKKPHYMKNNYAHFIKRANYQDLLLQFEEFLYKD